MIIRVNCKICDKEHYLRVNDEDYVDFKKGELAQNAFPYLDAGQRELLISGICPTCWDNLFGNLDEEGDEK